MFSPYYALARRRGRGDPAHHCSVNVALYGRGARRWSMTERGRGSLGRTATSLSIGPSSMEWDGDVLTLRLDEVTAPLPSRIRGVVRLHPGGLTRRDFALDAAGRHRWHPISPASRVEVELERPSLRWSGPAYLDTNAGSRPLEADFSVWDWSRTGLGGGTAAVLYEATRRDGTRNLIAIRCGAGGEVEEIAAPPPRVDLPPTLWRVPRGTRADEGFGASVAETVVDAPFYARSVLRTRLLGRDATAMHESLSMDRFTAPWVQAMLPFRMPRRAW